MSAERATNHLPEPNPPQQLTGFPTHTYPAGTEMVRSHTAGLGPWWFASNGAGRFDLAEPRGTCYVAEDEVVTLLERFGGQQVVPDYLVDGTEVSTVVVVADIIVADLTDQRSTGFGVTSEIFTTADYPLTQRWAAALRMAGYGGVRYWARHDVAHDHRAVAVFGDAGPGSDITQFPIPGTARLTDRDDLLERWHDETGVTVLPVPRLGT